MHTYTHIYAYMDKQRGMKDFIFSKSKRIALLRNYDFKKKEYMKRERRKNLLFMREEVFARGKASQKGQ